MLTEEEARRIGLRACVEKIGIEFCEKHKDTSVCAYGVVEGVMQCYFGVDDQPNPDFEKLKPEEVYLSCRRYAPYFARCEVNMESGVVTITDFCIPA